MKIPSHEQLIVFAAIAEIGSFSGAAKKLQLPPTTVSRRLTELEYLVGVELIHRTTRQCRLSADGQYYLERFSSAIMEIEEVARFLNQSQTEPEGILRVTAPVSYGIYRLQPLLSQFYQDYPKLTVQLFLKNEYVDLVAEGYDLAIRAAPLNDSDLVAKKIDSVAYHCVASPKLLNKIPSLTQPEDLLQQDCISLGTSPGPINWALNSPAGDKEIIIQPRFTVNDPIYALSMVKSESGIAYLPDFIVQEAIEKGELQPALKGWQGRSRDIFAVYHNRSLMPLSLKKLLSYL